jgi:glycosyltransferase involved in cell wall biosynthesis
MLLQLLSEWRRSESRIESAVVSLLDQGAIGPRLAALSIPVHALNAGRGFPNPAALLRLASIVRAFRPDVIKAWMYHANLLGSIAAPLCGVPVVWGVHHATTERRSLSGRTALIVAATARLSRIPRQIVCVSEAGLRAHVNAGYAAERMTFVPNGIDVATFQRSADARARVRSELGAGAATILAGIVGRVHPDKAHGVYLAAAAQLEQRNPDLRFVLCGTGTAADDEAMSRLVQQHGATRVIRLGARADMPAVYSALDILVSSSSTEAFSLTIAEGMSCGLPCVVTAVGDSASIVGGTGRVVPPNSPAALADAIQSVAGLSSDARAAMGAQARQRIVENFAIAGVARRYADILRRASATRRRSHPVAADAARTEAR